MKFEQSYFKLVSNRSVIKSASNTTEKDFSLDINTKIPSLYIQKLPV